MGKGRRKCLPVLAVLASLFRMPKVMESQYH